MKPQDHKKTEEILKSLDGIQGAKAPDFFYTRLKARMEKEILRAPAAEKRPWLLRPAFALAALILVLLINAAVILQGSSNEATESASTDTESIQTIAAEYNLNDIVMEEVYK